MVIASKAKQSAVKSLLKRWIKPAAPHTGCRRFMIDPLSGRSNGALNVDKEKLPCIGR